MKLFVRVISWFAMLHVIAACSNEVPENYTTIADADKAQEIQTRLVSQPQFNMAKIYVARLSLDGNDIELTSLVPAFFRGYRPRERGFQLRDGYSYTLMAFNEERSALELLTRDYTAKKAYHEVIPVASIDSGLAVRFPLVSDSGTVKLADVTFRELRVK